MSDFIVIECSKSSEVLRASLAVLVFIAFAAPGTYLAEHSSVVVQRPLSRRGGAAAAGLQAGQDGQVVAGGLGSRS